MHEGEVVSLPPKAFDILLLLVRNNGRVLEKDELMKSGWPGSFVEEGNLTQNIFVLRRILGDDQNGLTFIQTIPRRGYKFVSPVKLLEISKDAPECPLPVEYWREHSPFRGLQVFERDDAWLFFGREAETQELLIRLAHSPVLVITGNSGCGKSSLIRAGLIPALRKGWCQHAGKAATSWHVAITRPSGAPFDYLAEVLPNQLAPNLTITEQTEFIADCRNKLPLGAEALRNAISALAHATAQEPGQTRILLVVDQFEELFTLTPDREIRQRYLDMLLAASRWDACIPVHLVLILRADFYAHCLEYSSLSRCLEINLYNVPHMSHDQLREAVEKRLALAGAHAESGLIDSLLNDVGAEPGNLALLEQALSRLWEKCGGFGCTLSSEDYAAIGRLRGALSTHADAVYQGISDEVQKLLVRKIFLELVCLGEGDQDTSRRVHKEDLLSLAESQTVESLLTRLAVSRLISIGREGATTIVEVSHEALIRGWPLLREWLAQNREELLLERRLIHAAREWEELKKETGALLQGARLLQAEEWLARHHPVPALLREFVQASIQQRLNAEQLERTQQEAQLRLEAEQATAMAALERNRAAEQARAARNLKFMVVFLLLALICAGIATAMALAARRAARRNADLALESAAAAQAGRQEAETATLLAQSKENDAQAARREVEAAHAESSGNLQIATEKRAEAERYRQEALRLRQTAESRDRDFYQTLKTEQEAAKRAADERDEALRQLQIENDRNHALESILARAQQEIERLKAIPPAAPPPDNSSGAAADALPVRLMKEAQQNLDIDSDLSVWLALYALQESKSTLMKHNAEAVLRRAVWKAHALPQIEVAGERNISAAEFSPDNTMLLTLQAGLPKKVDIWDPTSGQWLATLNAEQGSVIYAAFSPDSKFLAMSTSDGTTRLWDTKTWQPQPRKFHDSETIACIATSADGRFLVFAGKANSKWVHLWDVISGKEEPLPLGVDASEIVTAIQFNEGNTLLAIGTEHGGVIVYNVASGKPDKPEYLPGGTLQPIRKIVFGPGDRKLAALDEGDHPVVWELSPARHFRKISTKQRGPARDIAFGEGGNLLATWDEGKKIAILNVVTGDPVDEFALDTEIKSPHILALSHDGKWLSISEPSRRRLQIYPRDAAQMADFAARNAHRKLTAAECETYLQRPCPP